MGLFVVVLSAWLGHVDSPSTLGDRQHGQIFNRNRGIMNRPAPLSSPGIREQDAPTTIHLSIPEERAPAGAPHNTQ